MGLTHSLARALGPDGITVNCLVPSIVGTETVNRDHAAGIDAIVAEQAVGRYQQPGDLVGADPLAGVRRERLHDRPDDHGRRG